MKTKQYEALPLPFMWVRRIEAILEQEGLSAPKTKTFSVPGHHPCCFAADVIAVTLALKKQGRNPFRAERSEVLRTWDDVTRKRLPRRLRPPSFGKSELVAELRSAFECSTERAEEIVEHLIGSLKHALLSRRKVEFRGFGGLVVVRREAKVGRDPKNPSKGSIPIPPRFVVKFKVGKELDEKLNASISAKEASHGIFTEVDST